MFETWQTEVIQPISDMLLQLMGFLPSIFYSAVILIIGWLMARGFRVLATRIGSHTISRAQKANSDETLSLSHLNTIHSLPNLIGLIGFWIVLLFFAAAAIQTLGINILPALGNQFSRYIPDIITAIIVFSFTYAFVKVASELLLRSQALRNIENIKAAVTTLQVIIWSIALLIIADQLGVRSNALLILFAVLLLALFGAFALSFGLGARQVAANLISIRYAQKTYQIGDTIEINGNRGVVTDITRTSVVINTEAGQLHIPGYQFTISNTLVVNE